MLSVSDSVLRDGDAPFEEPSPSIETVTVRKDLSAISVARASYVKHRFITRRSDNIVRYDGSSPDVETVFSPRYRELRCEREMKRLQAQQSETEEQLVRVESELRDSKCKVESLTEEITTKKARIRDMEVNEKLYQRSQEEMETKITLMSKQLEQLQRHYEIQKERLIAYKASEEKWEAKKAELDEALYTKNNAVVLLQRELRDVKDELSTSWENAKNAEHDISRMQKEIEELRRNAEIERKEYKASVEDWRNRLENALAENLATCAADVERNAIMALEMREKTDEKSYFEYIGVGEHEIKDHQLELEESIDNFSTELQYKELDSDLADGQYTITQLRCRIKALDDDNKRLEVEKEQIENRLERKTKFLKEALMIMNCLNHEVSALKSQYCDLVEENISEEESALNPHFLHLMALVEAYCRQFEQLELRTNDNEHTLHGQDADLAETISDLQYRLFAADQRQAAYEKERQEYEVCIKRLKDTNVAALNEVAQLKEQILHFLEKESKSKEQMEALSADIDELKNQLITKSDQVNHLTEALKDSLSANVNHAEMLANVRNKFVEKLESAKFREALQSRKCDEIHMKLLKKEDELKELQYRLTNYKAAVKNNPSKALRLFKTGRVVEVSPAHCRDLPHESPLKNFETTKGELHARRDNARELLDSTSIHKICRHSKMTIND
ncbi:unnamed protein product [Cylicocyclus nassatus]|uniref:Uncharacterized protein n=1 Tax=Cylicocyclus nassatus TaxID=53992 RepID=A0AA36M8H5_CYLNA|nr:unnamed protein product [Cylicocyclus nassatus]CAJ0600629.1 unnamed protein product [Cylicocyclus nassatus]